MAKLDRIVNVAIALNTTAIKQQEFSDLLILGPHAHSLTRTLIITDADELLDLGFLPTDPIYKAALSVFSQIPTISRVFIGRQLVTSVPITVTQAVNGAIYTVTFGWRDVNGVAQTATVNVTADGSDTPTTIAADLATAIEASAGAAAVVATSAAGVLTITPTTGGQPISVNVVGNLSMPIGTSTELPSVALAAAQRETDDWYGVSLTSRTNADILDAAAWVEANEKLLGVTSADAGIIDAGSTVDIASLLEQQQYFRTHIWYHADAANEWLDAAVAARVFTYYPGQETWALKRLGGIEYDTLSEGQAQAAFAKNANTFEQFRNFAVTQNGKVAAGEWIDVIRFRDWLVEQIKINVVSAMINADGKVPYTDPGIQIIVTAMRQALDLGVTRNGIAPPELSADDDTRWIPSYTTRFPRSQAVAFNDKANRILRDVGFTARLAGAIHTVQIRGTLTYAL